MYNGVGFYRVLWKGGESRGFLRKSKWEFGFICLGMGMCMGGGRGSYIGG